MVVLSKRLQALCDMVTPGNRVADVGCDHGFVSIYLVQKGIAPYVYAMDVREGPLQRAKEHIASYQMEAYIETRLSDGVAALLPGEADAMVCAGMGGKLMQKILTEGRDKVSGMKELILQPQSEIRAFRVFLRQEGFGIVEEKMICEEGKYYPMMRVVPGRAETVQVSCAVAEPSDGGEAFSVEAERDVTPLTQEMQQRLWDKFGRLLLEEKNPVLISFLHFNIKLHEEILEKLRMQTGGDEAAVQGRENRIQEVLTEIEDMQRALLGMEAGNDYSNMERGKETIS